MNTMNTILYATEELISDFEKEVMPVIDSISYLPGDMLIPQDRIDFLNSIKPRYEDSLMSMQLNGAPEDDIAKVANIVNLLEKF